VTRPPIWPNVSAGKYRLQARTTRVTDIRHSRVVLQPSSKTDFVVLGEDAGPKKLAAIQKHGIKTINEDEFLTLIATRKGLGNGKVDDKTRKKLEKEQQEIKEAAKEMEKREKQNKLEDGHKTINPSTQLWTVRYAPQHVKEICGNKSQVEKIQQWLHDWHVSLCIFSYLPADSLQGVERKMWVQENREEWDECLPSHTNHWSSGDW
jgi:hypothetical protein